jgi:hypothetical protein
MKDSTSEDVAEDSLADLWRKSEERRVGCILSCTVMYDQ